MPTSAIKDILKKWADVREIVLERHPNQADVSRVGDLYNDNAINYFRKILKKVRKAIGIGNVLQNGWWKAMRRGTFVLSDDGACARHTQQTNRKAYFSTFTRS
ncbi:uncharacterized protein TNCV_519451 [Trichonephila clavipes]|nr:uncharacterized protein TNCV_519451 [Trichonephila clavipes]